jgi:type VI secretion system protein ImpB
LETRNRLRDLVSKVDRSAELEGILEQVLKNTADLQRLSSELGVNIDAGGDATAASDKDRPGDDGSKS